MSMGEFECHKCGGICEVDGNFPKYFAWCVDCADYAEGFDGDDWAADVAADMADSHE